jgi:hypothetical protein
MSESAGVIFLQAALISHAWESPVRPISHAWEMPPWCTPRPEAPPGLAHTNRKEGPVQPALLRYRAREIAKVRKGGHMPEPN